MDHCCALSSTDVLSLLMHTVHDEAPVSSVQDYEVYINIFKCCTAVARLCIHVLSLSNKHILLRHVATAYEADDPKAASTLLSSSSFHEGYAGETKLCKMMKLYSFHSIRSHDHNEVYIPYKQGC